MAVFILQSALLVKPFFKAASGQQMRARLPTTFGAQPSTTGFFLFLACQAR
jgi:hypothetical protein